MSFGRPAVVRVAAPALLLLLVSCQDNSGSNSESPGLQETLSSTASSSASPDGEERWFSADQVARGREVFAENCAACHGAQAEGLAADWRDRLPDGSFPPPPLNGTAHAWHHPLFQLLQTIETGGIPYGGKMPPFADVLEEQERLDAVAYFQSFWTEEIYLNWLDRGGLD